MTSYCDSGRGVRPEQGHLAAGLKVGQPSSKDLLRTQSNADFLAFSERALGVDKGNYLLSAMPLYTFS